MKEEKIKKRNIVTKAGIWFTICNLLQRGIQFLVTPVYTRLLMPEGYGRYSTFLTWCNLFGVIATLSLSSGVFNKAMAKYEDSRDDYLTSMIGLSLFSTLVAVLVYFCVYPFCSNLIGLNVQQSILMFICIYFQMVIQLWSARRRYEYDYKPLIITTMCFAFLIPTIGISLYYLVFRSEMGVIIGYTTASLSVGLVLFSVSIRGISRLYNRDFWKYALAFNMPLIPHYLSNILMGQSDRLMISHYCGDYYTGIYTLAYQISLVMSIVSNGMENAITPWTYENIKSEAYDNIKSRLNPLVVISTVPFIMIMLIAPEFVSVLGSSEYKDAIFVIPPVVASTYIMFINTFLVSILFYYEKNVNVMISTSIGAIANIILNAILLPRVGYIAAAYTTFIGYLLIFAMNFVSIKRKLWNVGGKIYSIKIFTISIAIICAAIVVSIRIYSLDAIYRWSAIGIGCLIAFAKKDKIIQLLENKK